LLGAVSSTPPTLGLALPGFKSRYWAGGQGWLDGRPYSLFSFPAYVLYGRLPPILDIISLVGARGTSRPACQRLQATSPQVQANPVPLAQNSAIHPILHLPPGAIILHLHSPSHTPPEPFCCLPPTLHQPCDAKPVAPTIVVAVFRFDSVILVLLFVLLLAHPFSSRLALLVDRRESCAFFLPFSSLHGD